MTTQLTTVRKNAVSAVSEWLQVDPDTLKKTLKATVFRIKDENKQVREATDEEFVSLMVIANTYKLNPIVKELYAFPAKGGGIVPIVSTDGWTRIMTSHPQYKCHSFRYSEKMVTMKNAKPCPEWCEVDIEKKDGSHVVVREYLDEVFRDLSYPNAWQTHTKRFLRHKTKIQGAREAFGFSGIYDEDEGERIIEATDVEAEVVAPIQMPRPKAAEAQKAPETVEPDASANEPEAPSVDNEPKPALPDGFKVLLAKHNGLCGTCGQEIRIGDEIYYNPSKKKAHHPLCLA